MHRRGAPGGLAETSDHYQPKSVGGRLTVPCCRACNELKGNMLPVEWRQFRDRNPDWWTLWGRKARHSLGVQTTVTVIDRDRVQELLALVQVT